MINTKSCLILLFNSTSEALLAEKLFIRAGISYKIMPVPRHISSDCGVCIRFFAPDKKRVCETLARRVDIQNICPIN